MVGSEQGGIRPVLIIQNNIGNQHSQTVDCLLHGLCVLPCRLHLLADQLVAGELVIDMNEVDTALEISVGLHEHIHLRVRF